jgi:hypothetical protein
MHIMKHADPNNLVRTWIQSVTIIYKYYATHVSL